ncbi:hypothetical protein ACWDOR_23770 [Streptosporangium canum]
MNGIDWGDAPGWAAIGFSLIFSLGAFVVSLRGLKWQRLSAEATVRSANTAEQALASSALERRDQRELQASDLPEGQGPEEPQPRDITWRIEHFGKHMYVLRNEGSDIATGVTADRSQIAAPIRQLPEDAAVRPGGLLEFMIIPTWQSGMPAEIWLTWDGQEEPVAVPMPPS